MTKRNIPTGPLTKCEHGCRLTEMKTSFNVHLDEMEEALDFAMAQYNRLAYFVVDHVVPYLEHSANTHGDEEARDLMLDLILRTHDFREQF